MVQLKPRAFGAEPALALVKAQEQGGKEVNQEEFYSDHQDVEGVKVPMKMTINRDGKKFVEAENSNVKLFEKLDDSMFNKP